MQPEVERALQHAEWVARHGCQAGVFPTGRAVQLCQQYVEAVRGGLRVGFPHFLAERSLLDPEGLRRLQQALAQASRASGNLHNSLASSGVHPGLASSGVHPGLASSGVHPGLAFSGVHPGLASSGVHPGLASSGVHPGLASSG
ncbi:MAG: hypothetical protein D6731_03965, partial [Planctomycetota bacterium]